MKSIPLSGKRGEGLSVIVDDKDYDFLSQFSWSLSRKGYAQTSLPVKFLKEIGIETRGIHMQRLLLLNEIQQGCLVDHINRNKLDNRRCNLRVVSIAESNSNRKKINFTRRAKIRSKYKGIHWSKNRWRACITVRGKRIYLGFYNNEKEAALAYNKAASLHFGEYACLNVI